MKLTLLVYILLFTYSVVGQNKVQRQDSVFLDYQYTIKKSIYSKVTIDTVDGERFYVWKDTSTTVDGKLVETIYLVKKLQINKRDEFLQKHNKK